MSFADALAAADSAAAGFFDMPGFTALPMARPERASNAPLMPDTSREAFGFSGSLDIAPEFTAFTTGNRPTAADRQVRQISRICLSALSTGWPWVPREGDRIRTATALYALAASPDTDGTARIVMWLNRISGRC
ncbi:MAG: hypothetical protein B7X99_10095 [Rhizobiales bacterium 17-65-6]|nr:MAG: hypothetical protein B7Y84_15240 [Azorhizobium sp. 32-67-21]OYZ98860.1 MAG: hypothetical protein B7X99_10095 [Rhizobiales bacterium 17-65-6]